jgi:hypothetical protein
LGVPAKSVQALRYNLFAGDNFDKLSYQGKKDFHFNPSRKLLQNGSSFYIED